MIHTFKTNLHCGNCVSKVRPGLDGESGVSHWNVDLESPEHTLTVEGKNISPNRVREIVNAAGFEADEVAEPETKTSYYPLVLLISYLLGIVSLIEVAAGSFDATRAMANFMAGFFLTFSFFKLLDVRAFADSYAMYDLLARRSRVYALAYPFIELALGIAYLVRFVPTITNTFTLIVMLVGTVGVMESLLNRRRVKCACLGAVFNLPMSYVTLIEDTSMAVMAAVMLIF